MNYIKTFEKHNNSNIIIKKGTKLFHSTIEEFNVTELRGGGYDNIIWTTKDSGISQTYIPVSGSSVYTNTDSMISPPKLSHKPIPSYTNLIGLTFKDIEYDGNGNLVSYTLPDEFNKLSEKSNILFREIREKDAKLIEYENAMKDYANQDTDYVIKNMDTFRSLRKDYNKLSDELDELKKTYNENKPETQMRKYVNKYLLDKGYVPYNDHFESSDKNKSGNYNYKLKTKYINGKDTVLPADYRAKGRLIILTPNEDLIIFDARRSTESDLTNLEYHNIGLFNEIEQNPKYDGILINDFAQVENEGNMGHISIGLFDRTMSKMDIEVISDVEHPDESEIERMFKTRKWDSKEYLRK